MDDLQKYSKAKIKRVNILFICLTQCTISYTNIRLLMFHNPHLFRILLKYELKITYFIFVRDEEKYQYEFDYI